MNAKKPRAPNEPDDSLKVRDGHAPLRRNRALRIATIALLLGLFLTPATRAFQAGGTTYYVYDDNGRLIAVVSPAGEAAVYEYDAAGNFTAIRRIAADTLQLLSFFPQEGGAGDQITFVGTGLGAGVTSVSFNGANGRIVQVTPAAVIAEVPDAATTGPVTITAARGTVVTAKPFVVVARVRIFPASATIFPGDTVVFTAVVGGGGDQSVVWSVNGIAGGNSTVGTISSTGIYTAPTLTGNGSVVFVISATSIAQPSLFGEAQVKVLNPNNLGSLFAPSVTVSRGLNPATPAQAVPVSVSRTAIVGFTPLSSAVSVTRGVAADSGLPVSVQFGSAPGEGFARSSGVSATTGPNISAIIPSALTRGTSTTITITGANLQGATSLTFIDASGSKDSTITASNITAASDGASITATVAVGATSVLGQRIVVVATPAGSSVTGNLISNTVEIVSP